MAVGMANYFAITATGRDYFNSTCSQEHGVTAVSMSYQENARNGQMEADFRQCFSAGFGASTPEHG